MCFVCIGFEVVKFFFTITAESHARRLAKRGGHKIDKNQICNVRSEKKDHNENNAFSNCFVLSIRWDDSSFLGIAI